MFKKSFVKGLAITLTAVTIATGASAAFTKPAYAEDLSSVATTIASDTECTADTETANNVVSAPLPADFNKNTIGQQLVDYYTKVPEDQKTGTDKFLEELLKKTNFSTVLYDTFMKYEREDNGFDFGGDSLTDSEKEFAGTLMKTLISVLGNPCIKEFLVKELGESYGDFIMYYGAYLNGVGAADELVKAIECKGAGQTLYHAVKALEKTAFAAASCIPGGGYLVALCNIAEGAWNTRLADVVDWYAEHHDDVIKSNDEGALVCGFLTDEDTISRQNPEEQINELIEVISTMSDDDKMVTSKALFGTDEAINAATEGTVWEIFRNSLNAQEKVKYAELLRLPIPDGVNTVQ